MSDVEEICLHFATCRLSTLNIANLGLCEARYAWQHRVALTIAGDGFKIFHRMIVVIRARADETHLAKQHVENLRQFIDTTFAQDMAEAGNSVHLERVISPPRDDVDVDHRAELIRVKRHTVPAHAFLNKKQRTGILEGIQDQQRERDEIIATNKALTEAIAGLKEEIAALKK